MMRSRFFAVLGALLSAPAIASATPAGPVGSPIVYVCTADAQVVKIDGTSASLLVPNGPTSSFDDCVVGPDGFLYIASGDKILRADTTGPNSPVIVGTLPAGTSARGLAFNVTTLYITTSAGPYKLEGTQGWPGPSASTLVAGPLSGLGSAAGRGVTFDTLGRLIVASGASIQQSESPYSSSTSTSLNPALPFGVAANTCGGVSFTDAGTQHSVTLLKNGTTQSTNLGFSRKDFPINLEIDSSNRLYVLVADDTSGANARVVRVNPSGAASDVTGAKWISNCTSFDAPTTLVDLKERLSGRDAIPGLLSARAVGLAIGPSAHSLSHTFPSTGSCAVVSTDPKKPQLTTAGVFDFGYHLVTVYYTTCPGITVQITAYKSRPSRVAFEGTVSEDSHPNIHPMPYSALGGFATEYALTSSVTNTPRPDRIKYGFFTQDPIATPGLARSIDEHPSDPSGAPYDEDIRNQDFWDVGVLDAAGGERENDFSKRVVYNSDLAFEGCEFSKTSSGTPLFDEPLNSGNPLFNGPQNIKISIGITGPNCQAGKVRVSIVRIYRDAKGNEQFAVPQTVRSNSQTTNLMDSLNGKYTFNLDATILDTTGATKNSPAEFKITLSGNVDEPLSKPFFVQKQ